MTCHEFVKAIFSNTCSFQCSSPLRKRARQRRCDGSKPYEACPPEANPPLWPASRALSEPGSNEPLEARPPSWAMLDCVVVSTGCNMNDKQYIRLRSCHGWQSCRGWCCRGLPCLLIKIRVVVKVLKGGWIDVRENVLLNSRASRIYMCHSMNRVMTLANRHKRSL